MHRHREARVQKALGVQLEVAGHDLACVHGGHLEDDAVELDLRLPTGRQRHLIGARELGARLREALVDRLLHRHLRSTRDLDRPGRAWQEHHGDRAGAIREEDGCPRRAELLRGDEVVALEVLPRLLTHVEGARRREVLDVEHRGFPQNHDLDGGRRDLDFLARHVRTVLHERVRVGALRRVRGHLVDGLRRLRERVVVGERVRPAPGGRGERVPRRSGGERIPGRRSAERVPTRRRRQRVCGNRLAAGPLPRRPPPAPRAPA